MGSRGLVSAQHTHTSKRHAGSVRGPPSCCCRQRCSPAAGWWARPPGARSCCPRSSCSPCCPRCCPPCCPRLCPPVAHAVAHPVAVAASADPLAEVSPYNFNYAVADDYSASNFQAAESSDGLGVKTGSYSVALPDGRTQTVNYSTDDVNGYVADVSYEGVPQYPPVAAPVAVAHTTVALAHPVAHAVAHPVAHAVAHPAVSIAHPATTLIG